MLNSREGRVFVELNYPHLIGIPGHERHHDVATWPGEIRLNSFKIARLRYLFSLHQSCQRKCPETQLFQFPKAQFPALNCKGQTHGKPWRSKGSNRFKVLRV